MHKTIEVIKSACKFCTHEFPGGHICASPALRGQAFCYHHHPERKRVANPNERRARRIARQSFTIPMPTDPRSLQHSLGALMQAIADNRVDNRRAGLILFALQIAGKNMGIIGQM